MKNSKVFFLALFLAAAIAVPAVSAAAVTTVRLIKANYMGIHVYMDGRELCSGEEYASVPEPFYSGGTAYVPIDYLEDALGREASWDRMNRTILIGDPPAEEPSAERTWILPPYSLDGSLSYVIDGRNPDYYFYVSGMKYLQGVWLEHANEGGSASAVWNTGGQLKSMTFRIGHADASDNNDAVVTVYRDAKVLASMDISWSEPPKQLRIPLSGFTNVRIEVQCQGKNAAYCIFDVEFEEE